MNDDRFGGELHAWIEPEIEARLVALILGEASAFEAEELDRMMKERPELRIFKRRLEVVHDLMGEAVTPPDHEKWRLAPGRRAVVTEALGIDPVGEVAVVPIDAGAERRVRQAGLRVAMMAAACLVISVVLASFLLRGTKSGWAAADRELASPKSVSVSLATDDGDGDEASAAPGIGLHAPAMHAPGQAGQVVQGPARAGEEAGRAVRGSAVGDRLAALKDNLGSQAMFFAQSEPPEDGAVEVADGAFVTRSAGEGAVSLERSADRKGRTREDGVEVPATRYRETATPSSAMSRVIGSATPADAQIPVPDVPEPSTEFGTGDDFGAGWGAGGGGGASGNGRVSGPEKPLVENGAKSRVLTKHAEVRQANTEEMNFDSVEDAAKKADVANQEPGEVEYAYRKKDEGRKAEADEFFLGGGTVGDGPGTERSATDFIRPVEGVSIPGIPAEGGQGLGGVVTGGLRSGDAAVTRNNIDAILNNPERGEPKPGGDAQPGEEAESGEEAVPGVLSITGLLNDDQQQMIRRGLREADQRAKAKEEAPAPVVGAAWDSELDSEARVVDPAVREDGREFDAFMDQDAPAAGEPAITSGIRSALESLGKVADAAPAPESETSRWGDQVDGGRKLNLSTYAGYAVDGELEEREEPGEQMARQLEEVSREIAPMDGKKGQAVKTEPERTAVEQGLAESDDPVRTNAALSFEHAKDVDKVRRDLYTGEGHYHLGKFDEAQKQFESVLRTDPDNQAARKWMERIESSKSDYYRAAYDETRAKLLSEVDAAWEMAVPPGEEGKDGADEQNMRTRQWAVPPNFVRDLEKLGENSAAGEIDPFAPDAGGPLNGRGLVARKAMADVLKDHGIELPEGASAAFLPGSNTLVVKSHSGDLERMGQIVDEIGEGSPPVDYMGLYEPPGAEEDFVEEQARDLAVTNKLKSTIIPAVGLDGATVSGAEGEDVLTRRWKLHPDVLEKLQKDMMANASGPDDPFADAESRVRDSLAQMTETKKDLIEILRDCGISFPPGASVRYLPDSQSLVVKNTPSNLDLVDALMEQTAASLARERQAVKTNEKSASEEAFSTFSLHVSDVSFKLAQTALAKGEWPEAERIRVEEFVNAFDYGDPAPGQDEKVACALEQAAHPFMQQRNMLRISMRTAAVGRAAGTPLRLTVLLDNSGSMERADRAESVQRAFQLLAAQMHPEDEVTLISFARKPRLVRDSVPGGQAAELVKLIADTPSEGGTNLEEALRLGMEKAQEDFLEGAQNRIILLTDGAANLGNAEPELLGQMVEQMRQKGIAFDACGVGADGLNDDVLEALTRKGDGRYYFLDRPEDADAGFAKQIAGALRPAAKNVKVQVEFNPKRVGHYRLYGFEKHELKKEDFRNDRVDAAEMAAEEAGVAMYQVETLPDGEGDVGSVSVRFQDMATGGMVEKRWTIPYEANPAALEDAAPSMKLAASAAFLGEKLKGTPVGDLVELGELSAVSRSLPASYTSNQRVGQLIEMIEKARGMAR